jgi:Raf kinase inhibitor-like YbhB/YbcL family protein
MMRKNIIFLAFCFLFVTGSQSLAMELRSPEFKNNEVIPEKFTCHGKNINPELTISAIPAGTKNIALIFDDPDAPGGDWVHWVVFDIPVISVIKEDSVPGKQGINDFGKMNYGGPCPPSGTHRYFFRIYALDAKLHLKEKVSKADLEAAMDGHVLAKAELIGLSSK